MANCITKLVAMATSLSIARPHLTHDSCGPSEPTTKWHLDRFSRCCTDDCRVSLYFTVGRPFPPSKLPLPWPELLTQTASESVQQFLQGWLAWQTDRPTEHATQSVTIRHIYVRSSAMRPSNVKVKPVDLVLHILHDSSSLRDSSVACVIKLKFCCTCCK